MLKLQKSKKVIIPAAILLIVAGILVYFSDRLTPFIIINYLNSKTKTPEMYLVPTTREVLRSAKNFSIQYDLSYKNIKFKAPWVLREKIKLNYGALFAFMNKKGIEIVKLHDDQRILKGLLEDDPSETQKWELLYSEENLESEYAFVNLILHTTPDQADLFKPLPELVRVHPLLLYKLLYSHLGDVIYKSNVNDFNVFQFGNPQNTNHVRVDVFNKDDQVFKFHFVGMTQVEIDIILSTIEFI
jgi:hypothetical protein